MKIYLVFFLLFFLITDNEALGRTKYHSSHPKPIVAHPSDEVPLIPLIEAKNFPWTMKKEPSIRVKSGRRVRKLPLESYVTGVIGNEMGKNWPREALKAQAVAARSYALSRMNKAGRRARYDVVATQADQVFRARDVKNEYLAGIVSETRGEILWADNTVVAAYYSSTCGGKTRSAQNAGLDPDSPLTCSMTDPSCKISPFRNWAFRMSLATIENEMNKEGLGVAGLRKISVRKKDASGYVIAVYYQDNQGGYTMTGGRLRNILGYINLKSLLFRIVQGKDGMVKFSGNGFGHGVGLCQYGAKSMALKKGTYRSILKKYYRNIQIVKAYE